MSWMITGPGLTAAALAVAGLAVLAFLGLRVAKEVGRLVAELRRASHGIRAAAEDLEQAIGPVEGRGPVARP
jgi:hypothetical protein